MSSQESLAYLDSFINYEKFIDQLKFVSLKLDRVKLLLELLGNPELDFPIIHVAGSKGKGSTAMFTASILKAAGLRCGLYTSPHLNSLRERVRVLAPGRRDDFSDVFFEGMIKEDELTVVIEEARPFLEIVRHRSDLGRLSFFEVLTALALFYFRKIRVDVCVLETGLGGRLDATNAVSTDVAVITPISLEHTQILGNTLREIAGEKAGIIKASSQQAVLAPQHEEALAVFVDRCAMFGIKPFLVGQDLKWTTGLVVDQRQVFDIHLDGKHYPNVAISLLGDHQMVNACVAWATIRAFNNSQQVTAHAMREGLLNARWPGRFEIIKEEPLVILDCAHNDASLRQALETARSLYPRRKYTLIVGVSVDKNFEAMTDHLKAEALQLIFTKARHPRARVFQKEELEEQFKGRMVYLAESVEEALALAIEQYHDNELILVTGSVFVVAEARAWLIQHERRGEVSSPFCR